MNMKLINEDRLVGVHSDLTAVVYAAAEIAPFQLAVVEGIRTIDRQKKLVASGASQTMRSRHLTGHAVDLAPYIDGEIRWDWPPFYRIAEAMKSAAEELGTSIDWGGDWKNFKDGPHWQLSWAEYPI